MLFGLHNIHPRMAAQRLSCGARSALNQKETKPLEKHAFAPSGARLCYATSLQEEGINLWEPLPLRGAESTFRLEQLINAGVFDQA